MNSEQLNFICNNTKGLKDKGKRMKVFEYLKNHIHSNGFVFFTRNTFVSVSKKYGVAILKESYSFLMVEQILVVGQ